MVKHYKYKNDMENKRACKKLNVTRIKKKSETKTRAIMSCLYAVAVDLYYTLRVKPKSFDEMCLI